MKRPSFSIKKTILFTLLAFSSSSALAAAAIPTYDCQPGSALPSADPRNNTQVVILNCTDQTLNINIHTSSMAVDGDSQVTRTPINVSDNGRKLKINRKLTLNDSLLTIDNADLDIGGGAQLILNGNSKIVVSGDHGQISMGSNSRISNEGTDNSITLNPNTELFWWGSVAPDNLNWIMPGDWVFTYRGGKLPRSLYDKINKQTTLQVLYVTVTPDLATRTKEMITIGHNVTASVLGDKTTVRPMSTLIYTGTQTDKAENIILAGATGGGVLELTGNLGEFDASYLGTASNYILLSNNDTHYTAFTQDNFTVIQPRNNPHPHIHYYGTTTPNWPNLFLVGDAPDNPAILTLEKTLPPLDLSGFRDPVSSNFSIYKYNFVQHNANGIIELNADQTITQFSDTYAVKVLAGTTLTYNQADDTPFKTKTTVNPPPNHKPATSVPRPMVFGEGNLLLTTSNAQWGSDAFTTLDPKLTVIFGNADHTGTTENVQQVTELPSQFQVAINTLLKTPSRTVNAGVSEIDVAALEGTIELSDTLDFSQANPFPLTWNIQQGNGSLVLQTSNFANPADLVGKSIPIAKGVDTFSVVLKGDATVKEGYMAYTYQLKDTAGTGATKEWALTVLEKDTTPPPVVVPPPVVIAPPVAPIAPVATISADASTLLSMAQTGIEAQIRIDALRLNHEVWHTERNSHEGLYTWIRAVGTYQKSSAMQDPLIEARYGHEAYAAGVNLGGEYQWSLGAQGQAFALSLATEYLSGARKVGDVRFKETRFNTALGLRLQGEKAYGALSVQWMNVGHKVMDEDQNFGHQHALEVSGEVGLDLHVTQSAGLTPFVQYNWTHFDKERASYHLPNQHHLQLGAYLTMPWTGAEGITVRNQLGLSTVLSIMNNDMPSLQAFWGLHLDGQRFGVQLQTSAEYAPGDQRRTVEVTLGTHYAF